MEEKIFDVVILGGGPAGLSAAVNVAARGGSCAVVANDMHQNPLWRAARIDNYPGLPGITGSRLLTLLRRQAEQSGACFFAWRANTVMPMGGTFSLTDGRAVVTGRRLILATGAGAAPAFAGEENYVGRGISYCATCDGRLYAGRPVLVTGNAADLVEEALFLHKVGCAPTIVTKTPLPLPAGAPAIPRRCAASIGLWTQDGRLLGLTVDGEQIPGDAVFILRQVSAPAALLPGLAVDGRFVTVDRRMRTSIPGCYAAGDITGAPLQLAKAVGEGLIAAQDAMRSLTEKTV